MAEMSATTVTDPEFPCSLTIHTPLPTARLATYALLTLRVDQELSPLVRRSFSTVSPSSLPSPSGGGISNAPVTQPIETIDPQDKHPEESDATILVTHYKATTNRMLRVSVNGFLESLRLVLEVMQELDADVFDEELRAAKS